MNYLPQFKVPMAVRMVLEKDLVPKELFDFLDIG